MIRVMLVGIVLVMVSGSNELVAKSNQERVIQPDEKQVRKLTEEEKERLRIEAELKAHQKLIESLVHEPEKIPELIKQKKITVDEIPNPHWNKERCISCHRDKNNASVNNLRDKKIDKSCAYCHSDEIDHRYIHPTDINPSSEKMVDMSADMKKNIMRNNGRISCITCHDLSIQCMGESRQLHENKLFFRQGPYINRYELCSKCHKKENYQRNNPHEQIAGSGEIVTEKCIVCHSGSVDKLKKAQSVKAVGFHVKKNRETICWGCHQWKPHPGGQFDFFKSEKGPDHLVRPSVKVLNNIKSSLIDENILLPLDPTTGKIYCATCHNPHAKGVVKNEAADKGAGSKSRLRAKDLCVKCHTK